MEKNTETKICKKCREEINKKAKRCPKCGANLGMPGFIKVLIVIFIIIGCIVGCMGACTKGVIDAVDEAVKETENEYKDINGKTEFKTGESFENKHLKVTLSDVNLDFKNYSKYASVKSGYKIVEFKLTGTNVGESDTELFSYTDFDCYADDEAMKQFYLSDADENSGLEFMHELSKGKTGKGSVYCEVPKDAKSITLEYDASWLTSGDRITFVAK